MIDNDLLLKLANMIDHGQAGDMWDMNDVSEEDHARLPGLLRALAQAERVLHRKDCPFCGSPDGHYSASVGELSAAFFCKGCGINQPAQPPAAPVETPSYNLATGERDNDETDPAYFHSSAATGDANSAGDLVLIWRGWANALRLMDSKRSEPQPEAQAQADAYEQCATELREALSRVEPQAAQVPAASEPVVGPNVQTVEFDDNSGADPAWHKIQDQIDGWAQQTLPPDHALAIMSWSDRLAQHLTVTTTEPRGAEHHARRETQAAILSALLREARQYVSDAGSDEDGETQSHSTVLLSAIDTALSLSRQTEGK